jgi:lysophospholipase L1-like esterase
MELVLLPLRRSLPLALGAALTAACGGATPAAAAPTSAEAAPALVEHQSAESTAGAGQGTAAPIKSTPRTPAAARAAKAAKAADTTDKTDPAKADNKSAQQDADTPPPPLPKGTTVLHIGDSFAGALGIELDKQLKAQGVRGILRYKTASYIPEWAYKGKVRQYVAQYKPDLVLITLGANELKIVKPEQRIHAIKKLVGELGGRPCVWVGVPLWSGAHNDLLDVIRDNAGPCRFLDSTRLFPDMPRVHDHIHPTMNARHEWAKRVIQWLAGERVPDGDKPWQLKPAPANPLPLADAPPKKK